MKTDGNGSSMDQTKENEEFAVGGGRLWRQVAEIMREDIISGKIVPGQRIAPELTLAGQFNVSRYTVRRALADLEREGLVRIEKGRGLFAANMISYRIGKKSRYTENVLESKMRPNRRILSCSAVAANADLVDKLAIQDGHTVIMVEAIGEANNQIISYGRTWLVSSRFPDSFEEILSRTRSWTKTFAEYGVSDYLRKETYVIARLPSKGEASILKQSPNLPVLEMRKLDVEPNGRPLSYGITLFVSDSVQLAIGDVSE